MRKNFGKKPWLYRKLSQKVGNAFADGAALK